MKAVCVPLIALTCLIVLVETKASPPTASAWHRVKIKDRLDGGFIQYNQTMLDELSGEDWKIVLNEMKALGMKTVIVQYLGEAKDDSHAPPFLQPKKKHDPTAIILDHAATLGMEVFLGLVRPPMGADGKETNAKPGYWKDGGLVPFPKGKGNLTTFAKANSKFAEQVWNRYGTHPRFIAWYIPLENWVGDYPGDGWGDAQEYPEAWRRFYTEVTATCLAKAKKPVAISPCLPNKDLRKDPPEKAAKTYSTILKDTGLSIVMLQDSIGARMNDPKPLTIDEAKFEFRGFSERIVIAAASFGKQISESARRD